MNPGHFLSRKMVALIRRICRLFRFSVVIRSKVGIKTTYYVSTEISLCSDKPVAIDKNDLFLGPDYLIDDYTLLDCPLVQSPHYQLMKVLAREGEFKDTDYIRRYEQGTLDIRFPGLVSNKLRNSIRLAFAQSREKIACGEIKPVLVYSYKGMYYLYDGKHRAALCSLMGSEIQCLIMKCPPIDEFFLKRIISKMRETPDAFSKTLCHYGQ